MRSQTATARVLLVLVPIIVLTDALSVPILVKDYQHVNFTDYPLDAVVPLPEGNSYSIDNLGLSGGVPCQVKVIERWPSDDSLRHVLVHFQASLTTPTYTLVDEPPATPSTPLSVEDTSDLITVDTGKIKFTVKKTGGFNLIDTLFTDTNADGVYSSDEQVVLSDSLNGGHMIPRPGATGGTQYDSDRPNDEVDVVVEESGPLKVVIKASARTKYISTTDLTHGFAVRIYAYANKDCVKVDYQLQNSAVVRKSWILYLEAWNLQLSLAMNNPLIHFGTTEGDITATTGEARLAQERHDTYGIYDADGNVLKAKTDMEVADIQKGTGFMRMAEGDKVVSVMGRNWWQLWPNGFEFQDSKVTVELLPSWSAQWVQGGQPDTPNGELHSSGLYWLMDMQHVMKETMFIFHSDPGAVNEVAVFYLAKLFQFHPVATVDYSWHRNAKASVDLGGLLPPSIGSVRRPTLENLFVNAPWLVDVNDFKYTPQWRAWGPEVGDRNQAATTGGWPYQSECFIATGDPGDYYFLEFLAAQDMNGRPQWVAGYNYEQHGEELGLTENPYGADSWRFDEPGCCAAFDYLDAQPLEGTERVQPFLTPRDDQHGWFYQVFFFYLATGNLWAKDWYAFISEFRKTRLNHADPFPDISDRGVGHSVHHAYQAARVIGDPDYMSLFGQYLHKELLPFQDKAYGGSFARYFGFQSGFLSRALIAIMEHTGEANPQASAEAFQLLSGLMHYNLEYGDFVYCQELPGRVCPQDYPAGGGLSSGTSLTLVDPQAWYYWNTGLIAFWDHVSDYVDGGIGDGEPPFGSGFADWTGEFEGRVFNFVQQTTRADTEAPNAIADLSAIIIREDLVEISWTTPTDATRFHIVWCDRPISATSTTDTDGHCNWWAARTAGTALTGQPGNSQTLEFVVDSDFSASALYVAMFTFDASNNMSPLSNVAEATAPTSSTPAPSSATAPTSSTPAPSSATPRPTEAPSADTPGPTKGTPAPSCDITGEACTACRDGLCSCYRCLFRGCTREPGDTMWSCNERREDIDDTCVWNDIGTWKCQNCNNKGDDQRCCKDCSHDTPVPTPEPTQEPTLIPTDPPTLKPTQEPTLVSTTGPPTYIPTPRPTEAPSTSTPGPTKGTPAPSPGTPAPSTEPTVGTPAPSCSSCDQGRCSDEFCLFQNCGWVAVFNRYFCSTYFGDLGDGCGPYVGVFRCKICDGDVSGVNDFTCCRECT